MKKRKLILYSISGLLSVMLLAGLCFPQRAYGYDGSIDQSADHSREESMYLYTVGMTLDNPCNSNDMDDDAVCDLTFTFTYLSENGQGASKTYTLDMSWAGSRNRNEEILKAAFIRGNDNSCRTSMNVWVPGLVTKIAVHLNMDGGERLTFTVDEVSLKGFRVNTETDYVSSAYWDSDMTISCRVPAAEPVAESEDALPETFRDQFGGLFTGSAVSRIREWFGKGREHIFYHR